MKHKHETAQPAHLGQVERGVRPLVDRLRSRAWENRWHRKYREEAAARIEALEMELSEVLAETQRLRDALATESRRKCATEHDCVWQPHCANNSQCMRPERPPAA